MELRNKHVCIEVFSTIRPIDKESIGPTELRLTVWKLLTATSRFDLYINMNVRSKS